MRATVNETLARQARDNEDRWSVRRAHIFIAAASLSLWGAIVFAVVALF